MEKEQSSEVDSDRDEEERKWPEPPQHDFEKIRESFRVQTSSIERPSGSSKKLEQCFWRKIVWSPDGTHLLAQSDDHHIDMFQLYQDEPAYKLTKLFSIRAPTTVLAFEWYPFAQYQDAATWCFALSARHVPIRLIDAYQGRTRASYGIIDHVERYIGPQALAFSQDALRLYCALEAEIAIFDVSNPGINTHTSLKLTPSRRAVSKCKASAGQRGQISCLAVVQDHFAGTLQELLAVGTYTGSIGLYQMGKGKSTSAEERCLMGWNEDSAGVTQISFHPGAPHILFVTSRRSNQIRAYDLQYVGSRRSFLHTPPQVSLLATFERTPSSVASKESQQRLDFHLDWAGRYLLAGDADGRIQIWDIILPSAQKNSEQESEANSFFGKILRKNEQASRIALYHFKGADDVIASVMFHPTMSLMAVASGARHWDSDQGNDDDEDAEEQDYYTRDGSIRLFVTKLMGI